MNPRISIVIPCFNYSLYIGQALKSLQAQVFRDWECWVIDDGSSDSTAGVVAYFARNDPRIHYHYQVNRGQPAARNAGLKKSMGEYIQFLDADDMLQPEKLSLQLKYLDKHPETDIVYGEVRYFSGFDHNSLFLNRWDDPMKKWMPGTSGNGYSIIKAFVQQNILELGTALFRRNVIEALGGFIVELQGVEDYEFCFRAAAYNFNFQYLPAENSFCMMRHHSQSFSKSRVTMYRKELILRKHMNRILKQRMCKELILLNRMEYDKRLRRLQDLLIDQTYKTHSRRIPKEIGWLAFHSSIQQNLYLFPRILKTLIQ